MMMMMMMTTVPCDAMRSWAPYNVPHCTSYTPFKCMQLRCNRCECDTCEWFDSLQAVFVVSHLQELIDIIYLHAPPSPLTHSSTWYCHGADCAQSVQVPKMHSRCQFVTKCFKLKGFLHCWSFTSTCLVFCQGPSIHCWTC